MTFWIGVAVGVAGSWLLSILTVITLHALADRRDQLVTAALDNDNLDPIDDEDPLEQAWRLAPARKDLA